MIYFPLIDKGVNLDDIKTFDYGFIKFKQPNINLMENTLRILYYLNDLTWEEFMDLDIENLPGLLEKYDDTEEEQEIQKEGSADNTDGEEQQQDEGEEEEDSQPGRILITIAQHKHNHYLFGQANNFYLSLNKNSSIGVSFPNPIFTINQFSRNLNYQETNIYVNNLPIVFNNDDVTWESFWAQFGVIKSAKIIKPQFYHEDEDEHKSGKIGFVFYKNFKMAIRAILMTNNKVVNVEHFNPIIIQSSFAIQKSNNSKEFKQQQQQQQQHQHQLQLQLQLQLQQQAHNIHIPHHHHHQHNNNNNNQNYHHHHHIHLQPLHHLALQPHHLPQNLSMQGGHIYHNSNPINTGQGAGGVINNHNNHNNNSTNGNNNNNSSNGNGGVAIATAAAMAAAAAAAANNQPYFAYQPMIPYYYGYHPNPYQFTNGLPPTSVPPPPPPPPSSQTHHTNNTGHGKSLGDKSMDRSSGSSIHAGSSSPSVSNENLSGNNDSGGNPHNNMTAYSNYLIPTRAYPYYYFEGQNSTTNSTEKSSKD